MLATLLLAGIVAAPLSSAALFVRGAPRSRGGGAVQAVRGALLALTGTAVLAAILAGVLYLLGTARGMVVTVVVAFAVVSVAWLPATRAVERPRPPVLGVHGVPVPGLPVLHPGVDVHQPPRPGQYRRWPAAVAGGRQRHTGAGHRPDRAAQ